jgi:hypothetical protein
MSNTNQSGNTKTPKYIPPYRRNPFKGTPQLLKPLNSKSWRKRHYAVIDKDDFEYHYTPFQLTNAILSGLLNKNKIYYNKYYLSYINDYYQENLNEIFSLGSTISQKIIKYKYLSTSYKKSNIKSKLNFKKNYKKSHKKDQQSDKSHLSSISNI